MWFSLEYFFNKTRNRFYSCFSTYVLKFWRLHRIKIGKLLISNFLRLTVLSTVILVFRKCSIFVYCEHTLHILQLSENCTLKIFLGFICRKFSYPVTGSCWPWTSSIIIANTCDSLQSTNGHLNFLLLMPTLVSVWNC